MKVLPIPAFSDNYIWLIINEKEHSVLCVDPGDAKPVLDYMTQERLQLKAILLTHHHDDHIGGTAELLAANPGIAVYGPSDKRIPQITNELKDQELLELDSCRFNVISTPGHTSSHISLYEANQGWLFCGDTLFSGGCGRVFDGTIEELHASLQRLKALPDNTKVFAAHEYTLQNLRFASTVEPQNIAIANYVHRIATKANECSLPSSIALEKEINPFFRTQTPTVKDYAMAKGCKTNDSLSVFKKIRSEKDHFV